ncbi:MAG: GHKL domain-containing protein [Undibacterium sp.]|nr:GHKL domain-containing protein [Undibacterium sp.]
MPSVFPSNSYRLTWLRSGLFWRTFFLLVLLVTASMATWFISFKLVERKPRAQQMAGQIISTVALTRAALTHSAFDKRRELLIDLAQDEGIRIYPLETTDQIIAPDASVFMTELRQLVRGKLGSATQFAQEVNGDSGFWVSFSIEQDEYWLRLEQERLQSESGLQILGWALSTLLLSLIAAAFISKFINDPLTRIAKATRLLAQGKHAEPLPEAGAKEIIATNRSFNQMMQDLARIETDRVIILAGISHDLRTPITRMQLEIEMAQLDPSARQGMQADLNQMDEIIRQFLEYAKPLESLTLHHFNLSQVCQQVVGDFRRANELQIEANISLNLFMNGNEIEIRRLLNNLIENALRYGRTAKTEILELTFSCTQSQQIDIIIRDHGMGIPEAEIASLLRPFTRLDSSRSQANGSGLGLAIVERIVTRHQGSMRLSNHDDGGLEIHLQFPLPK